MWGKHVGKWLWSKYADDDDDDDDDDDGGGGDDDDDDDDDADDVDVVTAQETLFHPAVVGSSSLSFHSSFALPNSETVFFSDASDKQNRNWSDIIWMTWTPFWMVSF